MKKFRNNSVHLAILARHDGGESLSSIAADLGLTQLKVRQITTKARRIKRGCECLATETARWS